MLFHWISYGIAAIFATICYVYKDEWSMRLLLLGSIWYGILVG